MLQEEVAPLSEKKKKKKEKKVKMEE